LAKNPHFTHWHAKRRRKSARLCNRLISPTDDPRCFLKAGRNKGNSRIQASSITQRAIRDSKKGEIGTIRRECLDWVISLSEKHLRRILREWVAHYNRGRPHASLGPGIPEPTIERLPSRKNQRHELPLECRITKDVLSGLHHEYWFAENCRVTPGWTFCGGQGHEIVYYRSPLLSAVERIPPLRQEVAAAAHDKG